MRVTLVGVNYAPERSGIAPYTTELAEMLATAGHEVRVITSVPHYPEWRVPPGSRGGRRERVNGVDVVRVRPYVPAMPTPVRRALFEVSFGVRGAGTGWGRPDVLIFVSPALLGTAVAMLRARIPMRRPALGLWVQDLYSAGIGETGVGGKAVAHAFGGIERACVAAADGVAVIHERFRERLIDLGVEGAKVEVLRNWTHVAEPEPFDREGFRTSLGWGPGEVVVLHAGAMGAKQGLHSVVDAAALADRGSVPIRFVLLGEGSQRRMLEARGRGVARLTFADPVDDEVFARMLSAADVLLVNERPGVSDMAVPSKLTSYMASGRPILAATDINSATAVEVGASACGVRVDPARPDLLVLRGLRLGQDRKAAADHGVNGRRYCREVLSRDAALDRFMAWIEELYSRSRRERGRRR